MTELREAKMTYPRLVCEPLIRGWPIATGPALRG